MMLVMTASRTCGKDKDKKSYVSECAIDKKIKKKFKFLLLGYTLLIYRYAEHNYEIGASSRCLLVYLYPDNHVPKK